MDTQFIIDLTEVVMMVAFGFSWPFNVLKSYKARTTKGKSLSFLCIVIFGYISGMISKALSPGFSEKVKLIFYALNFTMVVIDLCLYIRNYKLDKKNGVL